MRFDEAIPTAVAERLREIVSVANLVAEYFNGDAQKVGLWFELPNRLQLVAARALRTHRVSRAVARTARGRSREDPLGYLT